MSKHRIEADNIYSGRLCYCFLVNGKERFITQRKLWFSKTWMLKPLCWSTPCWVKHALTTSRAFPHMKWWPRRSNWRLYIDRLWTMIGLFKWVYFAYEKSCSSQWTDSNMAVVLMGLSQTEWFSSAPDPPIARWGVWRIEWVTYSTRQSRLWGRMDGHVCGLSWLYNCMSLDRIISIITIKYWFTAK